MHHKQVKWLKLKLREEVSRKDAFVKVHTHLAIFSSCLDEGATIALYEPDNYKRNLPEAVFYLKTDHENFYESCLRSYGRTFEITALEEDFELPSNYHLVQGQDNLQLTESLSA